MERDKMPNYLLQWEAIRRAQALGCSVYDLWGAPDVFSEQDPMWGVYRFKEGLGAQVVRHIGAWDLPVLPESIHPLYPCATLDTGPYAPAWKPANSPDRRLIIHSLSAWRQTMHQLPRIRIAHLPTPVEKMPRLAAVLGGPVLSIKRDDLTGLAFGGNKTRKLEYLIAEAQANGARLLITTGAVQSNHCRQTAAAAARYGFECILVLAGDAGLDEGTTANLLLDQLLGAKIIWTSREERDLTLDRVFKEAWNAGKRPYLVPYGGSSPVGAAAYAFALQELLEQGIHPDTIVFATSSGGTQAGLVLGQQLFGYQGRVMGISIDEPAEQLKPRVANLANQIADLLDEKVHIEPDDVLVNDRYLGAGYGIPGAEEIEAVRLFARTEGILLDPVYTGRAAAGLLDLIRKDTFQPGEQVLFWHTGGNPALFAGRYQSILTA